VRSSAYVLFNLLKYSASPFPLLRNVAILSASRRSSRVLWDVRTKYLSMDVGISLLLASIKYEPTQQEMKIISMHTYHTKL
jgi:hypothetical protein